MTSREEIERLLQKTGRTLEDLPELYPTYRCKDAVLKAGITVGMAGAGNMICHQSDVIELLVSALRDALDKPMQKPLQKPMMHKEAEELLQAGKCVWIEERIYCEEPEGENNGYLETKGYGTRWRCWASRPTDEERSAAAWEN